MDHSTCYSPGYLVRYTKIFHIVSGSSREDIKLDLYDWKEAGDEVVTKWRFSCILNLPWRPLLAAAGMIICFMSLPISPQIYRRDIPLKVHIETHFTLFWFNL